MWIVIGARDSLLYAISKVHPTIAEQDGISHGNFGQQMGPDRFAGGTAVTS